MAESEDQRKFAEITSGESRPKNGNVRNLYAVYDRQAESFQEPFTAPTDGVAVRMFSGAVNNRSSDYWKYADDYTLWQIGLYDLENIMQPVDGVVPKMVIAATAVIKEQFDG